MHGALKIGKILEAHEINKIFFRDALNIQNSKFPFQLQVFAVHQDYLAAQNSLPDTGLKLNHSLLFDMMEIF